MAGRTKSAVQNMEGICHTMLADTLAVESKKHNDERTLKADSRLITHDAGLKKKDLRQRFDVF